MIAAFCGAVAVLAVAGALRPRPPSRPVVPPSGESRTRRWPAPWHRPRRPAITAAEVATWCEGLSRVVRGGSTLITALRSVEPPASCRPVVDGIVLSLDRGARLSDALQVSSGSSHLNLALTVARACSVHGGPPAEPLDRAASTLRGRAADAAERRTQSAQARLSAVVMTVLPLAMLALLLVTSASTRAAAVSAPGVLAIVTGGLLNVAGWRWMRRIVAQVES